MKITEGQPPARAPIRLFSRRDYGEYLVEDPTDAQTVAPEETRVDVEACVNNKGLAKLFNAEQQSLEAGHMRPLIEGRSEISGVEPYLNQKRYVGKVQLKFMRSLAGSLQQRRLPLS